jgi:hypothetical protein
MKASPVIVERALSRSAFTRLYTAILESEFSIDFGHHAKCVTDIA